MAGTAIALGELGLGAQIHGERVSVGFSFGCGQAWGFAGGGPGDRLVAARGLINLMLITLNVSIKVDGRGNISEFIGYQNIHFSYNPGNPVFGKHRLKLILPG